MQNHKVAAESSLGEIYTAIRIRVLNSGWAIHHCHPDPAFLNFLFAWHTVRMCSVNATDNCSMQRQQWLHEPDVNLLAKEVMHYAICLYHNRKSVAIQAEITY